MTFDEKKEALQKLVYEMTSGRDLGRLSAAYMEIDENNLYDVAQFIEFLLDHYEDFN